MKIRFGKIKWIVVGLCGVVVAGITGNYFYRLHQQKKQQEMEWSDEQHLDGYVLNDSLVVEQNNGKITITNSVTKEVRAKDIQFDWVFHSSDSLSVFCSDGKRGYYNRYTGRIVVKPEYRRAWTYSNNLAGVQKNGYIGFIDRKGNVVIPFRYPYHGNPLSSFVFSDGHCVVANEKGKCGVIDTLGRWVVKPEYKDVKLQRDFVVVSNPGHVMQLDYKGNVINSFVVDFVEELYYQRTAIEIVKDEPRSVTQQISTGFFAYSIGNRIGLMNQNCERLTEAIYSGIIAKSPNMFVASLPGYGGRVIINSKGQVVK